MKIKIDPLPSVVLYKNGKVLVGKESIGHKHSIHSVKRLMGKSLQEVDEKWQKILPLEELKELNKSTLKIFIDEKNSATPVEVAAQILNKLKKQAEKRYNRPVNKAVITVPAYFNDNERQATKAAAKMAGLDVLRLLNEPTSAALAYDLEKEGEGIYAVYDLGGGTFDISILKFVNGVFRVLAVGGDSSLGGDDLDYQIMEYLINTYNKPDYKPTAEEKRSLLNTACAMKKGLTENDACKVTFKLNGEFTELFLNRNEFDKIVRKTVDKTLTIMKDTIKQAGIVSKEIKNIILVGGSTKSPIFKKRISMMFSKVDILTNKDPEEIVAIGAALQAENLVKKNGNNLLINVVPLSLGIETMGGLVEKIIMRNTPIPTSASEIFTTYKNDQTKIKIHVCQGEYDTIKRNISLANFILTNIPKMQAGLAKIKVTFTIDADGLLTVGAIEVNSNIKHEVEVNPTHGLTQDNILEILNKPYSEDIDEIIEEKQLLETKVKAERMINSVLTMISEDKDKIDAKYTALMNAAVKNLEKVLISNKVSEIKEKLKKLDDISEKMIATVTEKYLCNTVVGKNIEDLK